MLSTLAERRGVGGVVAALFSGEGAADPGAAAAAAMTTGSPWFCSNMVLEGARLAINGDCGGNRGEGGWRPLSSAAVTG